MFLLPSASVSPGTVSHVKQKNGWRRRVADPFSGKAIRLIFKPDLTAGDPHIDVRFALSARCVSRRFRALVVWVPFKSDGSLM